MRIVDNTPRTFASQKLPEPSDSLYSKLDETGRSFKEELAFKSNQIATNTYKPLRMSINEMRLSDYNYKKNLNIVPQNQITRSNRVRWDIFFQDDDKLMMFYTSMCMTHNFFSLEVPVRYADFGVLEMDRCAVKELFNSLNTTVKYFNFRYKNNADFIKRFITGRAALNRFPLDTSLFSYFDLEEERERERGLAKPTRLYPDLSPEAQNLLKDYAFLSKGTKELMCLERMGNVIDNDLFYQLLHYYYYDSLMEPLTLANRGAYLPPF